MRVNLSEDVPFKAFVYRDRDLTDIYTGFTSRRQDFQIQGQPQLTKFYVHFNFDKECKFMISFTPTLTQPQINTKLHVESYLSYGYLFNQMDASNNQDFHTKIITSLQNMKLYEGLDQKKVNRQSSKTIINFNKRAVSNYSIEKRVQSAKSFEVSKYRIQSASSKKVQILDIKKTNSEQKHFKKELQILASKLKQKMRYELAVKLR